MMRWPHWPFQAMVAFGAAMYAIVLFIQCVQDDARNGAGTAK